jgi:fibronectin-binding autotransporter adhesin
MKLRTTSATSLLTCAVASLMAASHSFAAILYWDSNGNTAGYGTTNGIWGTSTFWSTSNAGTGATANTTITAADDINFGLSTLPYSGTVTLNGDKTARTISLAGASTVSMIGNGTARTIALGTGGLSMSNSSALTLGDGTAANNLLLNLGSLSHTWTNASSGNLTINNTSATFSRSTGATLLFNRTGTGNFLVTSGVSNDATGIIGNWAFFGTGTSQRYAFNNAGTLTGYTGTAATNAEDFTSATTNYDFSTTGTTTLTASRTANTIRYGGTGNIIDLGSSGSNSLTLNGILAAGASGALTLQRTGGTGTVEIGSSNELVVGGTQNITISAPISGSGVLNKSGSNILTLSGANTYTGATIVGGGTLSVSSLANAGVNSNIGAFASAGAAGLILQGGSTFNYTGGSMTTDRGFTSTGTGGGIGNTINIPAGVSLSMGDSIKNDTTNGGTGGLNITSGAGASLTLSSMTIISPGYDFNVNAANTNFTIQTLNLSGSSIVLANRGSGLMNVGTIVGSVSGTSWLVNVNLTGSMNGYTGTLFLGGSTTLTGSSTFNSAVTATNNGVYSFNSIKNVNGGASSLGNPTSVATGTITLNNQGGTLRYIGTGDTTDRVLNLNAGGTTGQLEQAGTGLLKFNSAITSTSGTKSFVLKGSTTGTGELAGAITDGAGGVLSITKQGTGKWTLSGANTYTGTTTISGGTLEIGSGGTTGSLSTSSAITNNANLTFNRSDTVTQGTDFAGGITGSGSLTKTGSGTLVLGNNSYSGNTDVTSGTLVVNGNISTSALTTVSTGATISGTGTVGALTINTGGSVTPGNSPGILTVSGNYTQAGTYTAEIDGLTPGTQHDRITVNGTVNITGGSLATLFTGTYAVNDMIFILLNDNSDAIVGTYTGLAQGAVAASYGGFDWQISYLGNSAGNTFTGGNDIVLMAVPEPRAALLGGLGLMMLLRRRRN